MLDIHVKNIRYFRRNGGKICEKLRKLKGVYTLPPIGEKV
jgi:hypothetical protein